MYNYVLISGGENMKINELKRIAEENDYILTRSFKDFKLERKDRGNCLTVGYTCKNRIWILIPVWCDNKDFNMIKATVKFAETPIEDREEEKKFYLKHRWLRSRFEDKIVNQDGEYEYFLSDESQTDGFKTQFTLKEIEEIKEKFDTDLADFELVEVEDED